MLSSCSLAQKLGFDTYDYIDKVISLSLSDPLCAAFTLYYAKTKDVRTANMVKYIRYGTIDETEIWLLRYGFAFEDIVWLKALVEQIGEREIVFSSGVEDLSDEQLDVIYRYL